MELQSLNTSSDSHFYYDKNSIHFEMPSKVDKKATLEACDQVFSTAIPTHLKNVTMSGAINQLLNRILELEPNKVYTLDSLLNYDFITDMMENPTKYGTGFLCVVSVLRGWLLSIGLMNKYDKEYLSSINFKDSDLDVSIESFRLPNYIQVPLIRAGLDTLYKIVLTDYKSLLNINRFNYAYMSEVMPIIKGYGYSLNAEEETPARESFKVIKQTKKVNPEKAGDTIIHKSETKRIMDEVGEIKKAKRGAERKDTYMKYKKLATSSEKDFYYVGHEIFYHSPYTESDKITNTSQLYNTSMMDTQFAWALDTVVGLKEGRIHRVDSVLKCDFEKWIRKYSEDLRNQIYGGAREGIRKVTLLRNRLIEHGLFNELDMEYLQSIKLKNRDFNKSLEEIGIDGNIRRSLSYSNIKKLYQLLLTDINYLGTYKLIGWERLCSIIVTLENAGYPARVNDFTTGLTVDQLGIIQDYRLNKVIDAKYMHDKKMEKLAEEAQKLGTKIN